MAITARERDASLALEPEVLDRDPVEQLHDEERRAVLGDVVVHHAHRARVLHRVGDVPLAQEAAAHLLARASSGWSIFTANSAWLRCVAA